MEEYIIPIIIGLIIGLIIFIVELVLFFKFGIDKSKRNILSPLAILLGVIYGFFGDK